MALRFKMCTMRYLAGLLKKYPWISKKMLLNIDLEIIRNFLGREFLSPIEEFALDGHNHFLYSGLNLNDSSQVVIFGGYKGISSDLIKQDFNPKIHIVEPIPAYANFLRDKYKLFNNIRIYEFAVSDKTESMYIYLDGEASSARKLSKKRIMVTAKNASEFISDVSESIELLEVNIEGGEYSVIPNLIQSGLINRIQILLIQFHKYEFENEIQRAKIRRDLSSSHDLIFEYPWVWERWDKKLSK
jgi:FkbM family methyltransferase